VEQVFAAVGGEPQLGEHGDDRLLLRRVLEESQSALGIGHRVADAHQRRRQRHAHVAMPVEVEEFVSGSHAKPILRLFDYGV
jgi:hypothetical protein